MTTPNITAIAPWYGSNRSLAHEVGPRLCGCRWLGIPFAGGMCELTSLADMELPRTILVSDLHAHVLNLAAVASDLDLNMRMRSNLHGIPHHVDQLERAQALCRKRENLTGENWFGGQAEIAAPDLDWAIEYFIAVWMSRNGTAGTAGEFKAPLSVRWDAGGGDSATRFRNATHGLAAWVHIMRRCTFVRMDVFTFLDRCLDSKENGLYLDPPFFEVGDFYKYQFTTEDHRNLATKLASFRATRILLRFYDHPLVRELYPASSWLWEPLTGGKTQTNAEAPEVLISRRVK
jgi:DNA adenine methylase